MAGTESTRDRIVAAATTEFAEHGIAGARVERIAEAARTSKERVYAYFRGKGQLYRFVVARELAAMGQAVPLDPADLPGYAVRVHDHVVAHPERLRLLRWGELEPAPPRPDPDDPYRALIAGKVDQVRQAQESGVLSDQWDPWDVLVFVSQIATAWAGRAQGLPDGQRDAFLTARRDAIEAAVARLFPRSTE